MWAVQKSARLMAEGTMEVIGLLHWAKRDRLPPIRDELLLKSATELVELIKHGKVRRLRTQNQQVRGQILCV